MPPIRGCNEAEATQIVVLYNKEYWQKKYRAASKEKLIYSIEYFEMVSRVWKYFTKSQSRAQKVYQTASEAGWKPKWLP